MNIDLVNKELESILSTLEFEENGGLSITGFDRYEEDWTLEFVVKTGVDEEKQLWQCHISNGLDFMFLPGCFDNLEIFKDHPLLWSHNQKQTSLYFGKVASDPHEVLSTLYSLHLRVTKGWIPFDKFLNPNVPLINLCKSTNGLLAQGPLTLLEEYMKLLGTLGMLPSIVGGYLPEGIKGQEESEGSLPKVLILGESYFIGKTFDFSRA